MTDKKKPMRAAGARGLDRTALALAKTDAALRSMDARAKGKVKFPASNSMMERKLFDESTKLLKERDAIRNQTKQSANANGRGGKPSGGK